MTEARLVETTPTPRTRASLAADLRAVGLEAGDVVVLHSSFTSLGWVAGGPATVLLAFQDVLTERGTLVVPTHTSYLTDPAQWESPPVPKEWIDIIRRQVPAFDPLRTPSRHMGVLAETFRTWPGVRRSDHPHTSFAAWGQHAETITHDHPLSWSMGVGSPLHRAYELHAKVMLLGTRNCTSLHLAEALSGAVCSQSVGAAVLRSGERIWLEFEDGDYSTDNFLEILADFCEQSGVEEGTVGSASVLVLDQRALVDHAVDHFRTHPRAVTR